MLQNMQFVHNGENHETVKLRHVKSKTRVRKDKYDFEKELSKVVKTNNKNLFLKHHKQKASQRALRAGR